MAEGHRVMMQMDFRLVMAVQVSSLFDIEKYQVKLLFLGQLLEQLIG